MEDVRIYDFECNLLHIEHDIASCNWSLYENDIGTFEMHFSPESPLVQVAVENRYLVAVQGEKQAIITGRQFGVEGVLYGRTCNWILTRFCVCETFDTRTLAETGELPSQDAKTVCMYLIQKGMGDIPNFVFEENAGTVFGDVYLQNKQVTTVFELVQSCMKQDGGGHRVFFDIKEKKWCFILTKGKMLSTILSEDNRNVHEQEYMADLQNFFSGGYFEMPIADMGNWNVFNNLPTLHNGFADNYAKGYKVCLDKEATGHSFIRRFDITFYDGDYIVCTTKDGVWRKADSLDSFIEQISPELSGIYGWKTKLDGNSEEVAKRSLAQYTESSRVSLKTKGFVFGQDYQLGDSVMQRFEKGDFSTCMSRKITGVHLWYEPNDIGEQPIFEEELN
ncbi:MAG: hypothetical protein E7400_06715 [Ruminococcaceae bacterium]|nr:hypothetical protein [Oscillospiraceae bacterium]